MLVKYSNKIIQYSLLVEFSDAVVDLLKIIIPTLIGAISSRFIINSWQVKKEKFNLNKQMLDLRKEIIDEFQKSYVRPYSLFSTFRDELVAKYMVIDKQDDHNSVLYILPSDLNLLPKQIFQEKFAQLTQEVKTTSPMKWDFFGTIQVYFDKPSSLEKKLKELLDYHEYYIPIRLQTLINSQNQSDFIENLKNANNVLNDAQRRQSDILQMLASSPGRKLSD